MISVLAVTLTKSFRIIKERGRVVWGMGRGLAAAKRDLLKEKRMAGRTRGGTKVMDGGRSAPSK